MTYDHDSLSSLPTRAPMRPRQAGGGDRHVRYTRRAETRRAERMGR